MIRLRGSPGRETAVRARWPRPTKPALSDHAPVAPLLRAWRWLRVVGVLGAPMTATPIVPAVIGSALGIVPVIFSAFAIGPSAVSVAELVTCYAGISTGALIVLVVAARVWGARQPSP